MTGLVLLFIYFVGGLLFGMVYTMIADMFGGNSMEETKMWTIITLWPFTLVCYTILCIVLFVKFLFRTAPKAFFSFLRDDIYYKMVHNDEK